jgi:hypothetical protein
MVAASLAAVAAVGGLSAVLAPLTRLAQSGPRVVAAVHASYPDLCNEWRDKLVASPSALGWFMSWDVSCASGSRLIIYPVMTVNVVTCRWRDPLNLEWNWSQTVATLVAPGSRLPVCP